MISKDTVVRDPLVELLVAAAGGDPAAWEALVESVLPGLWTMAIGFGLDDRDAADVCDMVSVRLAQSLSELAGSGVIGSWIARVGREECRRAAVRAADRRAPVIDISNASARRATRRAVAGDLAAST